jgi:hypothetical protein
VFQNSKLQNKLPTRLLSSQATLQVIYFIILKLSVFIYSFQLFVESLKTLLLIRHISNLQPYSNCINYFTQDKQCCVLHSLNYYSGRNKHCHSGNGNVIIRIADTFVVPSQNHPPLLLYPPYWYPPYYCINHEAT